MKAHQLRELVNQLTAIAEEHGQTAQLREQIAHALVPAIRAANVVPGVMRCAKCSFELIRVALCAADGQAYAGGNETEPCPNGCGPLWPVTWEERARSAEQTCEHFMDRAIAAEKRLEQMKPKAVDGESSDQDQAAPAAASRDQMLDAMMYGTHNDSPDNMFSTDGGKTWHRAKPEPVALTDANYDEPLSVRVALIDLARAVKNLRNWPSLQHLKKLRASAEFCHLVSAWEDAEAALAASPSAQVEAQGVPEGWKLLKDSTFQERSFSEDAAHENGSYYCTCMNCGRQFIGLKRRVTCKVCAAAPTPPKGEA